jgi:hypothetical protein
MQAVDVKDKEYEMKFHNAVTSIVSYHGTAPALQNAQFEGGPQTLDNGRKVSPAAPSFSRFK